MPEQFYVTEAIASNPLLATSTVLITDGRFSGATRGPAIGHVTPEAAHGGPIALVADGDLIQVDLVSGSLGIIGVWRDGQPVELLPEEVEAMLAERRCRFSPPPPRYTSGLLGLYTRCAAPASEGAGLSVSR
jgi:dihydroxy-acid dehydratase